MVLVHFWKYFILIFYLYMEIIRAPNPLDIWQLQLEDKKRGLNLNFRQGNGINLVKNKYNFCIGFETINIIC